MKKNFIIGIFAVVVSAGIVLAQTPAVTTVPSTTAPAAKAAAPAALVCEGTIASVSGEMIVVNAAAGKVDTLSVDAATAVKKAGKAAKITDLTVGAAVKVFFKKKAGKMIATKILEKAAAAVK